MLHILYNPKANNGKGLDGAKTLEAKLTNEQFDYVDFTALPDFYEYLTDFAKKEHADNEKVVLAGGDGTINYMINLINARPLPCEIYYAPAGNGNDFMRDVATEDDKIICLNKYIEKLPTVVVNDKRQYFLNGIGYGIDGYCCEEADRQKAKDPNAQINYTAIAVKGLLFKFKPRKATITIDGVTRTYKHVWLAPIMNGRFYGGGMNVAPAQDRLSESHDLSCIVMHTPINLYALMVFPNIFKGKLVNFTKIVHVFTGKHITVEFDKPCAMQVDGETVLGMTKCEAFAYEEK